MTKEDLKKELENVSTIYVVGITRGTNPHWDKGIWRTFRLYYLKNNQLNQILIDDTETEAMPNYNKRKRIFESKVLGMDRTFEIVNNLSNYLFGIDYKLKPTFISY